MSKCKRCRMEVPDGTIHIFTGGEPRRQAIEAQLKRKVTLCKKPVDESYFAPIDPATMTKINSKEAT